MIWVLDLLFLFAVSAHLVTQSAGLGVLVFLINLTFFFQFGKTTLLLGESKKTIPNAKRIKAIVFSLLLASPFFFLIELAPAADTTTNFYSALNEDLFPVFIGICLLSALLMIALVAEKRKR
jgi:hypothetical protein